jgi:hypothetical protein
MENKITDFINNCGNISAPALESSNSDVESLTIKIKGTSKNIKTIQAILGYIHLLGHIGHSTEFKIAVDGDGNGRIRITNENNKDIIKVSGNREYIDSLMDENHDIKSFVID